MPDKPPKVSLTFRAVDEETWPDMEQLFESPGGPKYCWCMVWRATAEETKHLQDRRRRKTMLESRVAAGMPIGILGYLDGEPAAWCSIAPRDTYLRLGGIEDDEPENVWLLVCFYIPRRFRGQGLFVQVLEAAVQHAKKQGATVVEAYPVDPDSPSYRFMGFVESFKTAGFEEVGRAGKRRHVMRRRVG